mmetsp:Transcript_10311/g.25313  ORF Transcript_10311/g.25313 Transcript_10311/m.25313 type:complete len:250 (-) Transcript_10311:1600-2349(-)
MRPSTISIPSGQAAAWYRLHAARSSPASAAGGLRTGSPPFARSTCPRSACASCSSSTASAAVAAASARCVPRPPSVSAAASSVAAAALAAVTSAEREEMAEAAVVTALTFPANEAAKIPAHTGVSTRFVSATSRSTPKTSLNRRRRSSPLWASKTSRSRDSTSRGSIDAMSAYAAPRMIAALSRAATWRAIDRPPRTPHSRATADASPNASALESPLPRDGCRDASPPLTDRLDAEAVPIASSPDGGEK